MKIVKPDEAFAQQALKNKEYKERIIRNTIEIINNSLAMGNTTVTSTASEFLEGIAYYKAEIAKPFEDVGWNVAFSGPRGDIFHQVYTVYLTQKSDIQPWHKRLFSWGAK